MRFSVGVGHPTVRLFYPFACLFVSCLREALLRLGMCFCFYIFRFRSLHSGNAFEQRVEQDPWSCTHGAGVVQHDARGPDD